MTNREGGDGLSGSRVNHVPGANRPSATQGRKTPRGYKPKHIERAAGKKPPKPPAKQARQYSTEQVARFLQAGELALVSPLGNEFRATKRSDGRWILFVHEGDEYTEHWATIARMIQESKSCAVAK